MLVQDRFAHFIPRVACFTDHHQVLMAPGFGFAHPEAFWTDVKNLFLIHISLLLLLEC
jgi:hypothetical protein